MKALAANVFRQAVWDLQFPAHRDDAAAFMYDPDRRADRSFWAKHAGIPVRIVERYGK